MRCLLAIWLVVALAGWSCAPTEQGPPTVTYTIVATQDLFSVYDLHLAQGHPLVLRLVNADQGESHGLAVQRYETDEVVLSPKAIRGPSEQSFDLGVLPVGMYGITCPIQDSMKATLRVE